MLAIICCMSYVYLSIYISPSLHRQFGPPQEALNRLRSRRRIWLASALLSTVAINRLLQDILETVGNDCPRSFIRFLFFVSCHILRFVSLASSLKFRHTSATVIPLDLIIGLSCAPQFFSTVDSSKDFASDVTRFVHNEEGCFKSPT